MNEKTENAMMFYSFIAQKGKDTSKTSNDKFDKGHQLTVSKTAGKH